MAARLNKRHDEEARKKIQTSQLINRLQGEALGKLALKDGQRKSIEILLRKSLPDLSSVTLTGDADNPVHTKAVVEFVRSTTPTGS